jgi:hypothetical protein
MPSSTSVTTVYHSAKSRQVATSSLRSCADWPGTPATKKRLSVQPTVAFMSRHETINDVNISVCYLSFFNSKRMLD